MHLNDFSDALSQKVSQDFQQFLLILHFDEPGDDQKVHKFAARPDPVIR
jgi:hypothetical protein